MTTPSATTRGRRVIFNQEGDGCALYNDLRTLDRDKPHVRPRRQYTLQPLSRPLPATQKVVIMQAACIVRLGIVCILVVLLKWTLSFPIFHIWGYIPRINKIPPPPPLLKLYPCCGYNWKTKLGTNRDIMWRIMGGMSLI